MALNHIDHDDSLQIGDFIMDRRGRQLLANGEPVHANARYFDALEFLVLRSDRVVSRQELFDEVWGDSVVGDEALTQCIATLRRILGDVAANPAYIRTVPRRGYQFVADVERLPVVDRSNDPYGARLISAAKWSLAGGALAGVPGGLIYGTLLWMAPGGPALMTAMAVMLSMNVILAALAACAIALGYVLGYVLGTDKGNRPMWSIAGAAAGGVCIGASVNWLAQHSFQVLLGGPIANVTGGWEGFLLGGFIGSGLAIPSTSAIVRAAWTCALAAIAGVLIVATDGQLMAGSLNALADAFASAPQIYPVGGDRGQNAGSPAVEFLLTSLEAVLFAAGMVFARLRWRESATATNPLPPAQ